MLIVFFCRSELTRLYSKVAKNLNHVDFRFIAFSTDDQKKLISDGWNQTIIHNLEDLLNDDSYRMSDEDELDKDIMIATDGEFNLTKSIYADRALTRVDFSKARFQSRLIHSFWKNYINKFRPDFVIHEPCTLSINFIGACVLKNSGGRMIGLIQLNGFLSPKFAVVDGISGRFFNYTGTESSSEYLKRLNENSQIKWLESKPSLVLRILKSIILWLKIFTKTNDSTYHKVLHNYLVWEASKFSNITNLIVRDAFVKKTRNLEGIRYYFFPLHIEPESTVLYWGKYSYNDQVGLIKLIAANLPPDTVMVVKDHPHLIGYRKVRDYHALDSLKNVRLVPVSMNSSYLIKNSLGVFTINGTAGIESLILGRPVLCFGNIYYSHLKGCLAYSNEKDFVRFFNGLEVDSLVALKYYVTHALPGFTNYFPSSLKKYKGFNEDKNANQVAECLEMVLRRD